MAISQKSKHKNKIIAKTIQVLGSVNRKSGNGKLELLRITVGEYLIVNAQTAVLST